MFIIIHLYIFMFITLLLIMMYLNHLFPSILLKDIIDNIKLDGEYYRKKHFINNLKEVHLV